MLQNQGLLLVYSCLNSSSPPNLFMQLNSPSIVSILLTFCSMVMQLQNQVLYPSLKPPPSPLVDLFTTLRCRQDLQNLPISSTSQPLSPSPSPHTRILPGHGFVFVFVFVPSTGLQGASPSRHLGFVNRTDDGNPDDHLFGIGFDAFQNPQFNDINDNHVGVDVNSIASVVAHRAGYWLDKTNVPFKEVKLNSGDKYNNVPLVWIEYLNSNLSVSLARANEKKKPYRAFNKVPLDLSGVFLDEMYVGFTASTGQLFESRKILNWTLQQFNKYGSILMFWFFLERDVRIVVLIK